MKFSYQWLRELVPDLTADPKELERVITMKTAECEGIESFGAAFAQVIAARVLSVDALPKGKNKSVTIDLGHARHATVVCGAPNVRPGMLAAWVPPGTSLGEKTISTASIEGVESQGMLASAAELGINRDSAGLLELHDLAPGEPLPRLRPDSIIDIDNKSLTHRPDLWGHFGMAREVAAIAGSTLRDPVDLSLLPAGPGAIHVQIVDPAACFRYSALVLENINVASSPLWLQARLESIGLNGISNIVDITNFVLAELPQPMHAFDRDKLTGDTIFVRYAQPGERLHALNGETYDLAESDLVIADAAGPVALAGVIGGAASAISETTTRVVLESANFHATGVRLTSSRHKLRTDASIRFEKSLDPENTVRGLARALQLLHELCPGVRTVGGVVDSRTPLPALPHMALPLDFVVRKLGKQVTEAYVSGILASLGFGVTQTSPNLLTVSVPSWRATRDISVKDDLVEEVGRMIGYGEIVPSPPLVASVVPPANPMRLYLRALRHRLSTQGFTEVYNYSFLNPADVQRFEGEIEQHLGVLNPIASELTHLRRSLLPGLFKNIVANTRHFQEFRLFEIGNEIHPTSAQQLPLEVTHLAAALYSLHGNESDFFELKRVLECAFPHVHLLAANPRSYEHPVRTADIFWAHQAIGRLFELHPSLLIAEGVEGRAVLFDVDLKLALEHSSQTSRTYTAVRKYPTSGFDLSLVAALKSPVAEIENHLRQLAGDSLTSLEFIRQYTGPPLAEGQKSVSYRLEIGALDHTLSSGDLTAIRERIVGGLRVLGFEIRGLDGA